MQFPGNRIVKTAVAVFLTALICQLIGWPPVFAVITAIVTLEPTVSDSIKKGLVRFPASVIGSFYAVLFIALFGNSPITYTLAAALTIITSYRLKLHDGLLVATITAVAMIEVVYDNYIMSFLIRLGTTTIGITVSTLVNLLIFPPNFMKDIDQHIQRVYTNLGETLHALIQAKQHEVAENIEHVNKLIRKTDQLIHYEASDIEYFKLEDKKQKDVDLVKKELEQLRFIRYHISNLHAVQLKDTKFNEAEKQSIKQAIVHMANYMRGNSDILLESDEKNLKEIMENYWQSSHLPLDRKLTHLPNELVILYELLSIVYLVKFRPLDSA